MDKDANQASQRTSGQSDVQFYLISRYREALKTGDKSFAKSCLLSTRLFSVNDPSITNEIYAMAKTDGDICEAAKCFANLFDDLFAEDGPHDTLSSEALVVTNQMKEEIRILLNELKSQCLKLRSASSIGSHARQAPSVSQSPLLSPRLRMSSEDRSTSRDSMLRLDHHLNSSNKSFFYQQLFEHLANDVRARLLSHSIDSSDNPFEKCRLMMLAITISHDSVTTYGPRLLRTLMNLSQPISDKPGVLTVGTSRPLSMCHYAKNMLALDAIPMVFNLSESKSLDLDLDELLQHVINYYSEMHLEDVAQEYEFEELHEGLKKTLAARILSKDIDGSSQDDNVEANLNVSLNLLFEKFLHELASYTMTAETLKKLRSLVISKNADEPTSFKQIREVISELELEPDIPENILFASGRDEQQASQTSTATPPPKARGRPKKAQASVIVSPDDGIKRHLQNKARESLFVYASVMQYMFNNCSKYLKQTRSRILMRFDNPLAAQLDIELAKAPTQRSSRAKNTNADPTGAGPIKKVKVETQSPDGKTVSGDKTTSSVDRDHIKPSPLNTEHGLRMDKDIIRALDEIHECIVFLTSTSPTFTRLFMRFLKTNDSDSLKWYLRITADCMLLSDSLDITLNSLEKIMKINQDGIKIREERTESSELATLTVATGSTAPVEVIHLRALVQMISCHVQLCDKKETLSDISKLLERIKQSGMLNNDENYATGNIIEEFRVLIPNDTGRKEGFLFFDGLSLVRYVVNVLMDILRRYVTHSNSNSDSLIGHAIVLSQVDWPHEVPLYEKCISWIRANKPKSTTPQCLSAFTKFTYPDFFNYILDPNILEDFMALLNEGITLDIKSLNPGAPTSANAHANSPSIANSRTPGGSTRSGKAITTRGVNKTFKEDLKVALVAQMKSSTCLVPLDLISEFVQTSLVPSLMTTAR